MKRLVCKEYVWWLILLWSASLETNYKLRKMSRGKTVNQSKSKQWGAVNEVAGEGHAARPPFCHSLLRKETEETFHCLRSNGGCGSSSVNAVEAFDQVPAHCISKRRRATVWDLHTWPGRNHLLWCHRQASAHGADARWTQEISKD